MGERSDPPITLSEVDGVRYLHFGSEWIQGAMRIDDPARIEIEYVRQMMAWLLFLGEEQRVLQLGLGAGALTRFCHARLPGVRTTVVERSALVVQTARQWFALPREGRRLSVTNDDAGRFLRAAEAGSQTVIQVDLYDEHARGPVLDSPGFYAQCWRVLGDGAMLTVNLFGNDQGLSGSIGRIGAAFGGRVLALPQTAAGNVVVLAFKGSSIMVDWATLESRARLLESRLELEAPSWLAALREKSGSRAECFQI